MASSFSSREQSTDKDRIDFMVSDDSKTEVSIRRFVLQRINRSIPHPCEPTGEAEEGDFEPKQKKRAIYTMPDVQISICTCSSSKDKVYVHIDDIYIPFAEKALSYYNAKENTVFSFVKVTVAKYRCGHKNKIHINFIAVSQDGAQKLFFCELVDESVRKFKMDHIDEFCVKGCCLLQEIECGNPSGKGCAMCPKELIHPGPKHGHFIVGGDLFLGYPFWDYRSPPRMSNPTAQRQEVYFACAVKALHHFNSKQSTDFMPTEVVGSFSCPCPHKEVVHINFKGTTSIGPKQLFFAELVVPNFRVDCGIWDVRKEPYVVVNGCSLLEKIGPGIPFGRDCEICYCKEVIHPSPKNGYRVRVGDDFREYGFMNIGLGIF